MTKASKVTKWQKVTFLDACLLTLTPSSWPEDPQSRLLRRLLSRESVRGPKSATRYSIRTTLLTQMVPGPLSCLQTGCTRARFLTFLTFWDLLTRWPSVFTVLPGPGTPAEEQESSLSVLLFTPREGPGTSLSALFSPRGKNQESQPSPLPSLARA